VVLAAADVKALRAKMERDGAVHIPSAQTRCRAQAEQLEIGVQQLRDAGWCKHEHKF
jgi:hypothetical protein